MTVFASGRFPAVVGDTRLEALRATWAGVAGPGTWWSGEDKVRFAAAVRAARDEEPRAPWLRSAAASGTGTPQKALDRVAQRLACEAGSIDRRWADEVIGALGDAPYVELVAVAASVVTVDVFCEALGVEWEPLPEPLAGQPSRQRPDDVGDDGAYVPLRLPKRGANVGRSLSLVPEASRLFFGLEMHFYAAGDDFANLNWERPLSRPQVELVAARTSAVNECFY
jgi:hypothetical protein